MRFYNENIYPWLVTTLGDPEPIKEVRQRIIPLAQGTVLEIGVGPGVNFVHYDSGESEPGLCIGTQSGHDSPCGKAAVSNGP